MVFFAETRFLLDPNQNGFRTGRETAENTGSITLEILKAFKENKVAAAFLADVQGAYDNVSPSSLDLILKNADFPPSIREFIYRTLTSRQVYRTTEN